MHNLVVGITFSGKTILCKEVAKENSEKDIIVFDPIKSGGWPKHARCYSTIEAFSSALDKYKSALVFIDEAKTIFNEDKTLAEKWLTQYRHKGYLFFLIAQRAKMIPPNARNQCTQIYAFKQKPEDAKILADEYGDELFEVSRLNKLEFIYSDGYQTQKGAIQFNNNNPTIISR